VAKTDLQHGGGYTYQWQCAILLALDYFFEPVSYDDTLHGLVTSFGQLETMLLAACRRGITYRLVATNWHDN